MGIRLIASIAVIAIISFIAIPAFASPVIKVDNSLYEAGQVAQGKPIVQEFKIRNAGDQPLEVTAKPC